MPQTQDLKKTSLHKAHVAASGRMVPFAGWDMPVQYSSILTEARAVRSRAGLFDVSHMGRLNIEGSGAATLLNSIYSSDIESLRIGRARYGVICNEEGGIIDDCIVYRRGEDKFLLVPNASNTDVVLSWLAHWLPGEDGVLINDLTKHVAMISLQGPEAPDMLSKLTSTDLHKIKSFRVIETEVAGHPTLLARTGYTGEDGFEMMPPSETACEVWRLLVELGAAPCGLGARDLLRLEAGLLLHGNDMEMTINPYEAGLGRFVNPDRDRYVAGPALRQIRDAGPQRQIVGLNMLGRGIARHGHAIMSGSTTIGTVTSGSYSPTLDRNIGMGYVPTGFSAIGTRVQVDVRGRTIEAEVTKMPFYSRSARS